MTSATSEREPGAGRARVRAADVASAAGVSISTVSLVVNDKWEGRVAVETVARVRAEVDRLGYVVDESARRLATGGAAAVAVVTPAFTNPFYARVSLGAAAALGGAFQVVFSVPEVGDDPMATLERLRGLRLAGALVAAPSPELLQVLARDLPTVVLDAPGSVAGRPRVDLDVADGAAQLARHLVGLGHQRVAFLRATPETETFRVRHAALATHLASGGASLVDVDRLVSDVDAGAAHAAALASMPALVAAGVTAVVCATDLHAYGFLRACAERGIAVPSDMSVAGFDDQPLSAYVSPPLTTVAFPADQLGREAGRMLAELIARGVDADSTASTRGAPDGGRPALAARVLPVALVVRGSTGAASR
ncbi:MAG: LacI family DNA-binding transcriptional regulator [Actinobacteria bacterium]|nr:LacI family DNA-binding transcriptional regulator [Actinomycetota bacterium]